jgi:hypothetical protein
MSQQDTEWVGELAPSDAALLETAPGGALSDAGRRAAVGSSLSLLGVYFARGDQELVDFPAASRSADPGGLDALLAGLRLRAAIAAGRRLAALLEAIVRRPTFRYELRSGREVGSLSSTLDINRWITQPKGDQELIFPVLAVERGLRTPENVLAVYAVKWLLVELGDSFRSSLATSDVVEYQTVRHLSERLTRSIQVPALARCIQTASDIRTITAARHLIAQVHRRLRRREISHARPYGELARWINECLQGQPAVAPGDIDLSVYGDRFDSKLFELWCLGALGRCLAAALTLPQPSIDPAWRSTMPAYRLETFSGRIELFFQRGLRSIDERHAAQWSREDGKRLGGIPDIVVRAEPTIGNSRFAIIDPKLRQRNRLPADELYKILGYLQNYEIKPPVGIVIIYTTSIDETVADVFQDRHAGTLISVALNPLAPTTVTERVLNTVIRTILALIDYAIPANESQPPPTHFETDDDRDEQIVQRLKGSVLAWGHAHLGDIASSRVRIETLIGSTRWNLLDDDVQIMMATADLVGHRLDPIADFSGPAIGMCAALEHLLHAAIISPVVGQDATREQQTRTFGASIDAIEHACRSQGNQLHRDIRAFMIAQGMAPGDVLRLIEAWRQLNRNYRVPAAHRKVLSKADWQQLYRLMMGSENLFIQTFDALHIS